ncbi:MAG: hypothetical protein NC548_42325 [Lachnospiraceae bacterium]|nr:hypothetical protein [Lachnospiraceae bacterium]
MVIKSVSELENAIVDRLRIAVNEIQEKIYRVLDEYMQKYYADYSPSMYDRTYQLYKSFVKSEITPAPHGWKAEVYFDYSQLNYITGLQPSGLAVFEAALVGQHGAAGLKMMPGNTGIDIWDDPSLKLDSEHNNIIRQALLDAGLPVK